MRGAPNGLWLCVVCVALGAGCEQAASATRTWQPSDHGQPAGAPQDGRAAPPPQDTEGGQARAAQALYQVSCAGCHGPGGRGDGNQLPPGARPPNFTDATFMAARSDAALAETIAQGRALMPAFADKLSPAGIQALIVHIRSFASAPAAADDDAVGDDGPTPTGASTGAPDAGAPQ